MPATEPCFDRGWEQPDLLRLASGMHPGDDHLSQVIEHAVCVDPVPLRNPEAVICVGDRDELRPGEARHDLRDQIDRGQSVPLDPE